MATAKRVSPEPVPPPEDKIVLELTEAEASVLKVLTGQLSEDEWEKRPRPFMASTQKFVNRQTRNSEIYGIYNALCYVVSDPRY